MSFPERREGNQIGFSLSVPIEQEDIETFEEAIQPFSPPSGWLNRVLASTQFIGKDHFDEDLARLAQICVARLKDKPYAVMLTDDSKSDYWIYEELKKRGLHEAELKFDYDSDKQTEEDRKLMLQGQPSPLSRWRQAVPQEYPICTFDDFSISGAQIQEVFGAANAKTLQPDKYHAFFLYATEYALKNIHRFSILPHQSGQNIRSLNENLLPIDMEFIEKLDNAVRPGKGGILPSATLFWTWYKTPDSIPPIFTGDGLPTLIRTENFKEPYKKSID